MCNRARPNRITDVQTTVATSADENELPIIEAALKERHLLASEHLVDAGYTDAGMLAECQRTYGVDVIGPVTQDPSSQLQAGEGFDKTKFLVDWEAEVVTCPARKSGRVRLFLVIGVRSRNEKLIHKMTRLAGTF